MRSGTTGAAPDSTASSSRTGGTSRCGRRAQASSGRSDHPTRRFGRSGLSSQCRRNTTTPATTSSPSPGSGSWRGGPGSWSDPIGSIVKTRARSKPRPARRRRPAYQRQANPPAMFHPPQPSRPSADATPAARASPAQRPPRSPKRTRAAVRSRGRTATPGTRTPDASVAEAQPASQRPAGA